eukprot:TRINITY_DN14607_c1_g1_i1.p1 TRINITY_DN14607_c1_g1~~TRINITY_DN14607_c1_g1_i1.p1  ORF type:complete len:428 (+),score=114.30 TRINITY_DN14607_c1_g1_i1:89-1285(+)
MAEVGGAAALAWADGPLQPVQGEQASGARAVRFSCAFDEALSAMQTNMIRTALDRLTDEGGRGLRPGGMAMLVRLMARLETLEAQQILVTAVRNASKSERADFVSLGGVQTLQGWLEHAVPSGGASEMAKAAYGFAHVALACLKRLPIPVDCLVQTGIGHLVKSLRVFGGELSVSADAVIASWKQFVMTAKDVHGGENSVVKRRRRRRVNDESDEEQKGSRSKSGSSSSSSSNSSDSSESDSDGSTPSEAVTSPRRKAKQRGREKNASNSIASSQDQPNTVRSVSHADYAAAAAKAAAAMASVSAAAAHGHHGIRHEEEETDDELERLLYFDDDDDEWDVEIRTFRDSAKHALEEATRALGEFGMKPLGAEDALALITELLALEDALGDARQNERAVQ